MGASLIMRDRGEFPVCNVISSRIFRDELQSSGIVQSALRLGSCFDN